MLAVALLAAFTTLTAQAPDPNDDANAPGASSASNASDAGADDDADDDDGEAAALEAVKADDGAGDPDAMDPDAMDVDPDAADAADDDKPLVQRANEKLRDVAQEPLESLWGGPLKPIELPTIEKRSRPLENGILLAGGGFTVLGFTALALSLDANNELKSATPDTVDELTTLRDVTGISSGVLFVVGAAGIATGVTLLIVDPFDTAVD